MGYRSMVKSKVKLAFAAAKDLCDTVTLTQKNNSVYNFDTNLPTSTATVTKIVKGILIEKKRGKGDTELKSGKSMQMLFNADDLDDPDIYDKITMSNGDVWTMMPPCKSDGYLIYADVVRSA